MPAHTNFDADMHGPQFHGKPSIKCILQLILTKCIYAPVKEWQKRATLGAVFGAPSTAPNPPL